MDVSDWTSVYSAIETCFACLHQVSEQVNYVTPRQEEEACKTRSAIVRGMLNLVLPFKNSAIQKIVLPPLTFEPRVQIQK